MPVDRAIDISTLYSAPIILWVEDELSRDYLSHLWQNDPLVDFCIAGGNENIHAVVRDARVQGYRHVFGIRDRDFGATNRNRWSDLQRDISVFVLEAHEIENHLLCPEALAGCDLNTGVRSVEQILGKLLDRARELTAWMACRKTISDMRGAITGDFPKHPTCEEIKDLSDAETYISSSPWFSSFDERMQALARSEHLAGNLQQAQREYEDHLKLNTWQNQYSGKELFHHVRDWLYTKGNGIGPQRDADLAKAVARWQVKHGSIPQELIDLLSAIMLSAGL